GVPQPEEGALDLHPLPARGPRRRLRAGPGEVLRLPQFRGAGARLDRVRLPRRGGEHFRTPEALARPYRFFFRGFSGKNRARANCASLPSRLSATFRIRWSGRLGEAASALAPARRSPHRDKSSEARRFRRGDSARARAPSSPMALPWRSSEVRLAR